MAAHADRPSVGVGAPAAGTRGLRSIAYDNVAVSIGRPEGDFALGLSATAIHDCILSDEAVLGEESLFPHMAPRLNCGALDLVRGVPRARSVGSAGILFRRIRAASCDEFAPAEG